MSTAGGAPAGPPVSGAEAEGFVAALLAWFDVHGRRDLPWQREPTPYRVWVSEIMLQQTRVTVVVPYFERFMARFPDLPALARAAPDEVLHLWSGLGYYARARNLHRAAQRVLAEHGGRLPEEIVQLRALPGIGRSSAGAILSLACGQHQPILDGNCKRVLARCFGVPGWPGSAAVAARLWRLAGALTPSERTAAFNQAMMDLGATLCTRSNPACGRCPLAQRCVARVQGRVADHPAPKPRRALPRRGARWLLVADPQGMVLLQRRPASGIWGGLWTPPELGEIERPQDWCRRNLGAGVRRLEMLGPRRHTFTHFQLDIRPIGVWLASAPTRVADGADAAWVDPNGPGRRGLPAPVRRLLGELGGGALPGPSGRGVPTDSGAPESHDQGASR